MQISHQPPQAVAFNLGAVAGDGADRLTLSSTVMAYMGTLWGASFNIDSDDNREVVDAAVGAAAETNVPAQGAGSPGGEEASLPDGPLAGFVTVVVEVVVALAAVVGFHF